MAGILRLAGASGWRTAGRDLIQHGHHIPGQLQVGRKEIFT